MGIDQQNALDQELSRWRKRWEMFIFFTGFPGFISSMLLEKFVKKGEEE
ncbi:hypothetical protein A0O32_2796 [Anoxybacillus flavithermus]|uniref:Uncharacterized protein n=1 Tax=Anoxybacillus flavithermus TaxID=33934 RepID=A0A178T694_9BACL|nr:hypothetical protein TAF16_2561 [Anoxybacillus flavithermus]OAO76594.1 hypothetical protein A0O32_2796 [Anoxybacillus flavithermus]